VAAVQLILATGSPSLLLSSSLSVCLSLCLSDSVSLRQSLHVSDKLWTAMRDVHSPDESDTLVITTPVVGQLV